MYTATFTFAKREYDDEFHALDAGIAQAARAIPGYLGEESWENPASGLISNVYYWQTLEALQTLMAHPTHLAAKQGHRRWLSGYQIVIAKVVASHSDGGVPHPLAGWSPDPADLHATAPLNRTRS